jgi:stress-induced-phosphoprotein 1
MSAAAFKDTGNKALQSGNYDEAIAAYTKAIEIDPSDHVFYSNRSAAYMSKNEPEKALLDGSKCIELNPSWPKGYSRKGAALHALKKYEEALEVYQEGLKHSPDDAGLKNALNDVKKIVDSKNNSMPASSGLFGPQLLSTLVGHPKFGPKLADPVFMKKLQMLNTNPQMIMQDPELMEVLQVLLGSAGQGDDDTPFRPSKSASAFNSTEPPSKKPAPAPAPAPESEPENLTDEERDERKRKAQAITVKEKGNALYKDKKFEEAIAAYDEAYSIDPSNIMLLSNKAAVLIEQGKSDAAIALCEEALEKSKQVKSSFEDRSKIYQRIAAAHQKRGNLTSAIQAFNSAQMEMYDKAVERKIKNLELELKKLERTKYIDPALGLEAKERGNAAFRDGDFPRAIKEYEEAVKRDPTNASYYNNYAAALLKMGLFNDAKREVEKSLELDRNYVKAWAKKGDIEYYMKE